MDSIAGGVYVIENLYASLPQRVQFIMRGKGGTHATDLFVNTSYFSLFNMLSFDIPFCIHSVLRHVIIMSSFTHQTFWSYSKDTHPASCCESHLDNFLFSCYKQKLEKLNM